MPPSRTSKARRTPSGRKPKGRKATAGKPTQNAVRRKSRTQRLATASRATASRRAVALPGWRDLAAKNERSASAPRSVLDGVSTARFVLLLAAVALACTAYVGHVHATQQLLADVQDARRENLQLHLRLNRIKGDFDRATGPSVIHRRARALGLDEQITYGPNIRMTELP